jgi:hypothetical protein
VRLPRGLRLSFVLGRGSKSKGLGGGCDFFSIVLFFVRSVEWELWGVGLG